MKIYYLDDICIFISLFKTTKTFIMRKKIYFGIIVVLFATTLLSWNSGAPPGGKTGSTMDVNTCTECHGGTAISQDNWITSDIPITGYVPGATYTITASGNHTGAAKFGFEITSEDASSKVGTFSITDATTTKLANSNTSVTHTSDNAAASGSKTWSFDWTAPAEGTGDVTFFGAFNAANGNSSSSGDVIYTSQLAVSEATVGIKDNNSVYISIYPNPTSNFISFNSKNLIKSISIFDISGKQVVNVSKINNNFKKINLDILAEGNYFVKIIGDNYIKTEKIIIKK